MHRLGEVLDLLVPEVAELEAGPARHLAMYFSGNADAPRICESLQPGRDVHAGPEEPPLLDPHLAQMEAHTELHAALGGQGPVKSSDDFLDLDRTLQRRDGAAELSQEVVAREVVETTPVLADVKLDLLAPHRDCADGGVLIPSHEPGVTDHVGGEDRGELAFDRFRGHGAILRLSGISENLDLRGVGDISEMPPKGP